MGKSKLKVIRPAGMTGDEQGLHTHLFQLCLKDGE